MLGDIWLGELNKLKRLSVDDSGKNIELEEVYARDPGSFCIQEELVDTHVTLLDITSEGCLLHCRQPSHSQMQLQTRFRRSKGNSARKFQNIYKPHSVIDSCIYVLIRSWQGLKNVCAQVMQEVNTISRPGLSTHSSKQQRRWHLFSGLGKPKLRKCYSTTEHSCDG